MDEMTGTLGDLFWDSFNDVLLFVCDSIDEEFSDKPVPVKYGHCGSYLEYVGAKFKEGKLPKTVTDKAYKVAKELVEQELDLAELYVLNMAVKIGRADENLSPDDAELPYEELTVFLVNFWLESCVHLLEMSTLSPESKPASAFRSVHPKSGKGRLLS